MTGQALVASGGTEIEAAGRENLNEFVTFNIAGQFFGIPVLIVQDILLPENIASIPLAPPEVRGSINLRGRIVTVIDVRVRLGLESRAITSTTQTEEEVQAVEDQTAEDQADEDQAAEDLAANDSDAQADEDQSPEASEVAALKAHEAVDAVKRKNREHMMGVTVEHQNELYTLLVDSVGDVISLSRKNYEGNPSTLDPLWREFASGVYRLDSDLMVVLDVERLLDFNSSSKSSDS